MSAKKETFYVSQTVRGWIVRTDTGQDRAGPYTDREDAIAAVLVLAKESRPSHVRVNHSVGQWRVEYTYGEQPNTR